MAATPLDPFGRALGILEGKGKVGVISHLLGAETLRFSELERAMPDISQRRLVQCLRELEADGVVRRRVRRQVPPYVEYRLTAWGRAFAPVVSALRAWSISGLLD